MVLEKQDSGISLASNDGPDRKMSESDRHDLLKDRKIPKNGKLGGSDTKINGLHSSRDSVNRGDKDTASDNGGIMSDKGDVLSDKGDVLSDKGDVLSDKGDVLSDNGRILGDNGGISGDNWDYSHETTDIDTPGNTYIHTPPPQSAEGSTAGNDSEFAFGDDIQKQTDSNGSNTSTPRTSTSTPKQYPPKQVGRSLSMHTPKNTYKQRLSDQYNEENGQSFGSGYDLDHSEHKCSHTDLSAILGEGDDEHVPMHKTVCCVLCR